VLKFTRFTRFLCFVGWLGLFGSGVLNAAPALEVHLAHVKSLYSNLKEPAFFFVDENYDTVKAMQDAVNEAERHYALDYAGSELGMVVDAAMEMHILMAAAATYVVYEDLYEYHLEIACSRYREHYGYYGGQCQQVLRSDCEIKPQLASSCWSASLFCSKT